MISYNPPILLKLILGGSKNLLDREQEQSLKEVPLKEPQPAAQAEKNVLEDVRSQTGL